MLPPPPIFTMLSRSHQNNHHHKQKVLFRHNDDQEEEEEEKKKTNSAKWQLQQGEGQSSKKQKKNAKYKNTLKENPAPLKCSAFRNREMSVFCPPHFLPIVCNNKNPPPQFTQPAISNHMCFMFTLHYLSVLSAEI